MLRLKVEHPSSESQSSSPLQPISLAYEPLQTIGKQDDEHRMIEATSRWKHRISRVRTASRLISVILNTIMFTFMALVISIFLSTRDDHALGRPIWPRDPKTWPTVLLLTASTLTMAGSLALLCYYCFCFRRAANSWKAMVFGYTLHIILWIVVTILYRRERALSDLWGWSCTDVAKDLQDGGHIRVNFARLCVIQEVSWVLSIIETSFKITFAVIIFVFHRRLSETRAKQRLTAAVGSGALELLSNV